MELYTLKKPASIKRKKRVGIGPSSGHGKTSCRGHKGQMARSGAKHRAWFEGGQMPLQRRIPKRGFNNIFKVYYQVVNVSQLDKIEVSEITPEVLVKSGLIDSVCEPVKILGNGEISKGKKITADAFSASAIEKIKKAGGEAVLLNESK
ncbi:MAG TPA: 50S ribosomal protein L15 [Spirochaetota bacterium]|nr:50S ribosomal protein L15 [Spirochaetota bacterium]HPF04732.1 50S ribosomal protein L15 [Spirochaetota bacterium]HPJ41151.1 50S ribosomal protein L15 [Spirochaetota bacterium]HPR37953.1 50S ribosomal protein L15 [Spirochaetota bacterium]HRX46857.1 50S ribosomal protein L15 [Spirochaetota bacterium]